MATVPTAYTWTVGELVSASKLNSYLRDVISFYLNRPSAILTHSLTQSISDSTFTAVAFNTEVADTDGGHSTTTNTTRYVVQTAGTWRITANVPWATNAAGKRELFIRVNGATDWSSSAITAGSNVSLGMSVTDNIPLNVGDYVEAVVWQSSGAALNVTNAFHGGQRLHAMWERT